MPIRPLSVDTSDLKLDIYDSSLNATASSGGSTITIYSVKNFAVNQILLIGELGDEGSEIIKTHTATAPTGNTVTLASNLTKTHPKDTKVYVIRYDQVEFSHATTETGSKTVMATSDINPEDFQTIYDDSTYTTGYYFTRYKNSILTTYSNYSDPIPADGFEPNTFGSVINLAMSELDAEFSNKLSYDMLLGWGNEFLSLVMGKMKKWSVYQEFDYNMGNVSMGVRRFTMPTTIYDKNTNKSVLNVRIGNAYPLTYIDHSEYLQATEGATYTEVATQAEIAATSLVLDSTADLPDSGSVYAYVSGTKYTIEYTANTKSTNTLTVDSDQITAVLAVDTPIWYGITEESPKYYSIWDGYLYPWPMITSDYEGETVYMDFYTDIVSIDSDGDIIYTPRYDALKHYLKWKIRAKLENNGREDLTDPSYLQYREIIDDAIRNEELGQNLGFVPRGQAVYGGRAKDKR